MLNAKPDNKMLTENQGVAPTWWLQFRNNKKCSLKIKAGAARRAERLQLRNNKFSRDAAA